jgi:hypothetical protein
MVKGNSPSIAIAASRSAVPLASVTAVSTIGQQVSQIPQLGLAAHCFLVQARIGIGRRVMRVVPPHLPVEIDGGILRVVRRLARRVLRRETLMTRPGLEQRAVDGEVLIRQQPVVFDRREHFCEERIGDVAREQAVPVFGKRGRVPHRIVHAEAHEPAVEHAVIELLDQQSLAPNAVQHLQQQCPEELLGRDRGPARRRIQAIEPWRQLRHGGICHPSNRAQRVICADTCLGRDVAKHRLVSRIVASHWDAPFLTVGSIVVRRDQYVDPLRATFSAPC